MAEEHTYAGQLLAGIVYILVALRLGTLAMKTRESPEWLLSMAFMFGGASYVVYTVPLAANNEALWEPLTYAGRVAYIPAAITLALFTRHVFRPGARWASWLVYATAILMLAGVGGSAYVGDWMGYSINSPWVWLEWTGYTLPSVWTATEAIAQYSKARRRVEVGLCTPLVSNRYLLWSVYGVLSSGASLGLVGEIATFDQTAGASAFWTNVVGFLEIASLTAILLAFCPPRIYINWISGEKDSSAGNVSA